MIPIWDDHEVQDNYAGHAPGGGLRPVQALQHRPQAAAYKAFFEAMPFFPLGHEPDLPRAALRRATST